MEGVGRGQSDAGIPLLLKRRHRSLNRRGLTCDDGHLGRVLVGSNHVTFRGFQRGCNRLVRSSDAGHEAFVVDFNRAHLGSSRRSGTKGSVHVQNARRHQGGVFAQ